MNTDKIKITFKNGFVRIVERNNVRNFGSLIDWMDRFNSGSNVNLITLSGRDLGSAFSIDKNNVSSIDFV